MAIRRFTAEHPADATSSSGAPEQVVDPTGQAAGLALPVRDGRTPTVSVVVIAYNAARTLERCLLSVAGQTLTSLYEVILVDDHSTDDTAAIAGRVPGVRVVGQDLGRKGIPAARNRGMAAARGEFVAFTDADCVVGPDWLEALVSRMRADAGLAAFGGPLRPIVDDTSWVTRYDGLIASTSGHVARASTANVILRRAALATVGVFDETLGTGEDPDLLWRLEDAGWRVSGDGGPVVAHEWRGSFRSFLRHQFHYGEGKAVLARRHPERFPAWQRHGGLLGVAAAVGAVGVLSAAASRSPEALGWASLAVVVTLGAVSIGTRRQLVSKLRSAHGTGAAVVASTVFFPMTDIANAAGMVAQALRESRSSRR